jgi:predicted DNA-binding antitoxin AbrB/MazE fold protein
MSKIIRAVYEHGVFRPTEPVSLPDGTEVQIPTPDPPAAPPTVPSLDEIYALLSERFDSGETDVAERHNEHQP